MITRENYIDEIYDRLSKAENETIVLDEDKEVYLFDGDTEEQLGECFRIEALSMRHERGTQIFVWVDTDESVKEPREGWLIDDCSDYEIELIYETFFGEEEDDDDESTPEYLELIDLLDIDESMTCDEIFGKVFEHLDDTEDGQIPRSILSTTADGITSEICCEFDIEFHKNEW